MKTLTSIGIQKIGQRFVDSVDHADYTLNGVPQTAEPFRRFVQGASARVYIYFDDTVIGDVAEVQLVDKDGDIIASAGERVFTKTPGKGLYIAFKYNILEVEVDHVQDIETGEVIQEGTPVSQVNMNHMDEGIFTNREAVILHEAQIADAQKEIKVLKDATLNNMVNNVFLINFNTVTSVAITSGIYDSVARKIYV